MGFLAAGHNSIKRLVHRALEELRATAEIAAYTGWKDAWTTFFVKADIQLLNTRGYRETPADTGWLLKKHEILRAYFRNKFQSFAESYDFDRPLPEDEPEMRDRIWLCWWQGLEQAPGVVRQCIDSVHRCAGGHTVTVLTEENYRDYVQIPRWLEEKYRAGVISRTHFSDVLRVSLLARHGGLWLDATVFCAGGNLDACFSEPLWSVKRPGYGHISVGCGGFVTGTMQCCYDHRWIFAAIRDFLLQYWMENDFLVDYLMLDYLIDLVQQQEPRIRKCFERIPPNQPGGDELLQMLGESFDAGRWEEMKRDTTLFILSWKRSFPGQKDGKDTFYAKLLKGSL